MDRQAVLRRLRAARKEAEAAAAMLVESGLGMSLKESVQELSSYDNEPADIASETFEREKDMGLLAARESRLREIDDAERRLDDGTYGRCERCSRPIDPGRLEVVPWTRRCLRCQAALEVEAGGREAASADVVPMPYGVRPPPSDVGFDGEDAWQAVARFGTANSPQDTPPAVDPLRAYVDADADRGTVDAADDIVDPHADTPGEAFPELARRGRAPAYDPEDGAPSGRRGG